MSSETDDVMEFFSREDGKVIVTVVKAKTCLIRPKCRAVGSTSTDEIDPTFKSAPRGSEIAVSLHLGQRR